MKHTAIALAFALCAQLSAAQNASTVLSTLHARGTTRTGGEERYADYIPRLVDDGRLDYSMIPTNDVMSDVIEWVDTHGSRLDQRLLDAHAAEADIKVEQIRESLDASFIEFSSNLWANLGDTVPTLERDRTALAYMASNSIALGEGAVSVTNDAYQIGCGTNGVPRTFKAFDTVLVDTNGVVPAVSVPWAISRVDATALVNEKVSDKVLRSGDTMTGPLALATAYDTYVFHETTNFVSLDAVLLVDNRSGSITNPARLKGRIVAKRNSVSDGVTNTLRATSPVDLYLAPQSVDTWKQRFVIGLAGGGSITNTFTRSETFDRMTLEMSGAVSAVYTANKGSDRVSVDDVAVELCIGNMAPNPHGVTMRDIQEPLPFVDLVSPSGYIYRIKVSDDGLISTEWLSF